MPTTVELIEAMKALAPASGRAKVRSINFPGRELTLADTNFAYIGCPSAGATELLLPPMAVLPWTRTPVGLDVIELVFSFRLQGAGTMEVTPTQSIKLATNGTTASGNAVLHFASTTGVYAGQPVSGTGIPNGATVLSLTGTTVTLSANTTGVASAAAINFGYKTATLGAGLTDDVLVDWRGFPPSAWEQNGDVISIGSVATDSYVRL